MYAITGITGKVGGELARNLLAAGQRVRAIVRNASKAELLCGFNG
jgi:NAD(P)H dehydrogenase (quinone)